MEKIQTRFGIIEYNATNLLHFPAGMIGLPNLRNFVVIPPKKDGPLFWIQNVDDPDFAFILTDPANFFLDYKIKLDESEKNSLQIDNEKDCYTLSIVTVPPDQNVTINLAAPILYSPETNRAIQVILEDNEYQTKTPLPPA
jgi:flagellar assembly factor FliW